MTKTLIVLNPHAAGGRAGQIWTKIEPSLWEKLGELVVAVTEKPDDVGRHLEEAYHADLKRVISIGGDGTNHTLVNALLKHNQQYPDQPQMAYGTLPVGTGRDWARHLGIPFEVEKAADWITEATPRPVDVGLLTFDGQQEYFLNIASAGISGDISARVNRTRHRRPWTFLQCTLSSLLQYNADPMHIQLDGETWYEGKAFALAVANGGMFGHGMQIAPEAKIDDGLFDVILVEDMPRLQAIWALRMVYDGSHLSHPKVHMARAKCVIIQQKNRPLPLELDGEVAAGHDLKFEVLPGKLQLLT